METSIVDLGLQALTKTKVRIFLSIFNREQQKT